MPELILLAVVSLTAMGLLVFLFLRLTAQQTKLIEFLTNTNQSLLNQVRAKDLATLSGLEQVYTPETENLPYMGTDERELAAYIQALSQQHSIGEEILDEDLEVFRGAL
jgi:hypothetical protein